MLNRYLYLFIYVSKKVGRIFIILPPNGDMYVLVYNMPVATLPTGKKLLILVH